MSQRINISVPDDLYQKTQVFKDGLNISKICQAALDRAVSIEEMRSQTREDIERLASVFAKEREQYGLDFWEEGFRDGTKDAFQTDYASMYDLWRRHEGGDAPQEVFEWGAGKDTQAKVKSGQMGIDENFYHPHFPLDFHDFSDFYYAGWVAGFIDVWNRVCTKLSIHGFQTNEEAPHGDE